MLLSFWKGICHNPNVTWEMVQNTIELPFIHIEFTRNPNLTWEIVYDNKDEQWNWINMGYNRFSNVNMARSVIVTE